MNMIELIAPAGQVHVFRTFVFSLITTLWAFFCIFVLNKAGIIGLSPVSADGFFPSMLLAMLCGALGFIGCVLHVMKRGD